MLNANEMIKLSNQHNTKGIERVIDRRIKEMAKAGGASIGISLTDRFFLDEAMCNSNVLFQYLKDNQGRYEDNGFNVSWSSQYNETTVVISWKEE